ncbi:DNase I-like protein [Dioscorea alata]|uniref:DNase I-like protein n=1 Tax=Dioscorea alata TaxID=55571 RepID=A0ACB7WTL2_DIOAL|nr:DNase I-like protein [Dioscorea alata]
MVSARGSAGGIVIGWNSAIVSAKLLSWETFSLTVEFCSKRNNLIWRCTSVYGPNARNLKHTFWDELRRSVGPSNVPWIIRGDFNSIFDTGDKLFGPPNLEDIRMAKSFIQDLELIEPSLLGRRYSWTNGQTDPIWLKLARFVVNGACANLFPRMLQNSLPRLGSDHVPIRLELGVHLSNPRPFRYELAWETTDGFRELVSQWWMEFSPHGCGHLLWPKRCLG